MSDRKTSILGGLSLRKRKTRFFRVFRGDGGKTSACLGVKMTAKKLLSHYLS
jgi:hypothetical protein